METPGGLRYADYLDKQNQRKLTSEDLAPDPKARDERRPERTPEASPRLSDTQAGPALGPKLGDIPSDPPQARIEERIRIAYQVKRFAPTGSLVDVTI